ncbi:MAG: FAD-dependent oxidoreductase [Planctomycetota bacterium]
MTKVRTLILGGGLAGLSAAYHSKDDWLLVEKAPTLGGLARSKRVGGFTCDLTGHLIHCRSPYVKGLVEEWLEGNLVWFPRRSAIWFEGRLVRYPFQAYLGDLPAGVRDECLRGFREAQAAKRPAANFEEWVRARFGEGIARHFMLPYNRKVWAEPLANLDVDWTENRVPVPTIEEVERGASGTLTKEFGYNVQVAYPRTGGIQALTDAFVARLDPARLRVGLEATGLDLEGRRTMLTNLEEVRFERVISTIHPAALDLITPHFGDTPSAEARGMRSNRVVCLSVASPVPLPCHWVYVPDESVPFYRVGCSSLFSPDVAPANQHLLYVEIALPSGESDGGRWDEATWGPLSRLLGVEASALRLIDRAYLPAAYPFFDSGWRERIGTVHKWYAARGVRMAGRFGRWAYQSMEEAILDGQAAAEGA